MVRAASAPDKRLQRRP